MLTYLQINMNKLLIFFIKLCQMELKVLTL
jgi:hypothetical protein